MGPLLADLLSIASATPAPEPTTVDDLLVTPGVIGFAVTAVFIIVIVLLVLDMGRRMRRVRYREEARQRIAAELAEKDGPTAPAD